MLKPTWSWILDLTAASPQTPPPGGKLKKLAAAAASKSAAKTPIWRQIRRDKCCDQGLDGQKENTINRQTKSRKKTLA